MNKDDFLRSKLLIFLSIDILNSSSLKSQNSQWLKEDGWLNSALRFYQVIPEAVLTNWHRLSHENEVEKSTPPSLWKSLGDELIFKKEILSVQSLEQTIKVWQRVADHVEKELDIEVKITAWTAGFPIINTEIVRPANLNHKIYTDYEGDPILQNLAFLQEANQVPSKYSYEYAGPSIDIGFRLAKISDHTRFVISIEIAYLLTLKRSCPLNIYFLELKQIKCFISNYPVFWLARSRVNNAQEKDVIQPVPDNRINNYASDFLINIDTLCLPYFGSESSIPPEHKYKKEQLNNYLIHNKKINTKVEDDNNYKNFNNEGSEKLPDIQQLMAQLKS